MNNRKLKFTFAIIGSLAGLISCVAVKSGVAVYTIPMILRKSTKCILYSSDKFHAVEIPVEIQDGDIYLHATVKNRYITCLFDTGSEDSSWPREMPLDATSFALLRQSTWGDSTLTSQELESVPEVNVGNCQLTNLVGWKTSRAPVLNNCCSNSAAINKYSCFIIGNSAFANNVLCIDYSRKKITVYDANFKIPHAHHIPVVDMKIKYGLPVVTGYINGFPADIYIDTGTSGVGINERYISKFQASENHNEKVNIKNNYGMSNAVVVEKIKLKFANVVYTGSAHTVDQSMPTDGIVGAEILKHFRVYLDYPRKKASFIQTE